MKLVQLNLVAACVDIYMNRVVLELEQNGCNNGSVKKVGASKISQHSSFNKESVTSKKGLHIKLPP